MIKRLRFLVILGLIGTITGILGLLLTWLLFEIQHIAFGYSIDHLHSSESYLQGIKNASSQRKVIALLSCGLIAGVSWFLLNRYGKPLVSIRQAIKNVDQPNQPQMPTIKTVINALLQIITIALGSPLGKEGAPREVGALTASLMGNYFNLSAQERRVLIAAGAGAGLAAVYNVPIAGAFFALEVLLKGVKLKWIAITFSVSIIATLIARLGLGNIHQYSVSLQMTSFWGVLTFAVFTGPVFAFAAHWFVNMTSQARMNAPKQGKIIFYCLTNFILLGLLLIPLPELAGNGKSAAQVSFNGQITLQYALFLLIAKVFVEWGSLRAGAKGGLLTPSFANGALISLLLSVIWRHFFPEIELGVFAIIGAATFLSIANKMPLTAIAITLEMTQIEFLFVLPIATCVFIAWLTKHYFLPKEGIESY